MFCTRKKNVRCFIVKCLGLFMCWFTLHQVIGQTADTSFSFHNGDLVFQDLDCGELCTAIETVTSGCHGSNFSHVALVEIDSNHRIQVIEAIGENVHRTPVEQFLQRSLDSNGRPKVVVGRLQTAYQKLIPYALQEARMFIGKPYDDVFDIANDKYYCSELIYFSFKQAQMHPPVYSPDATSLFKLEPMTFKDPATGKTFPAWIDYFKTLRAPIPEGKPGLNPGGISRCACLDIFYPLGKPSQKK